MKKQVDGGHFLAGVPKDCFKSDNPCGQVAVAGNRAQLEHTTTTRVYAPAVSSEEDDSHLSDFQRVATADVSSDQILSGGIGVHH